MSEHLESAPRRTGPEPGIRLWVLMVGLAMAFVFGFLSGQRWQKLPGEQIMSSADPDLLPPLAGNPVELSPVDAPLLEAQLSAQIRLMRAEEARLAGEAREDAVHNTLLRRHGYSEDSPECVRLEQRRQRREEAGELLRENIREAELLKKRLLDATQQEAATDTIPRLDAQLHHDVQKYLNRLALKTGELPLIPADQWTEAARPCEEMRQPLE